MTRFRGFFPALFALFLALPAAAGGGDVKLEGDLVQGGLILGKTLPGSRVTLDGQAVMVSPEGRFVVGFHRDAGRVDEQRDALFASFEPPRLTVLGARCSQRELDHRSDRGISGLPVRNERRITHRAPTVETQRRSIPINRPSLDRGS